MTAVAVPRPRWAVPYRPLRARTLLSQLVVLAAAEVLLFGSYAGHDARFHWATHFLVGLIAAAVWLSVYLLVAARPAPGQLMAVLGWHLVAMTPDLLFRLGDPHERWMDVFLGHVSAHYLPGGDDTWLVLALLALTGYIWLLTRWLSARHAEAAVGLSPGIGIGGAAVVRAQLDPRTTPLAHHTEPASPPGEEHAVVLHDLAATGALWLPLAKALAARGTTTITVDLLGHGGSIRIGTRFTLADQTDAVIGLLVRQALPAVVLTGHGWGAAVAAEVARREPGRVRRLVLLDPPSLSTEPAAVRRTPTSWMVPRTLSNRGLSNFVCGLICLARRPLAHLARLRGGSAEVATAPVQHTYPPLRDAVDALLTAEPLTDRLRTLTVSATVLLSAQPAPVAADLATWCRTAHVRVVALPDDLRLPPPGGDRLADLILQSTSGDGSDGQPD
ncbi:MAG TPA: alpha/beta hydrolase [Cryptosporangiaceae bacterium]|nr:alpha/beta hydrolase [Cryptosporangiaceae bacterium]